MIDSRLILIEGVPCSGKSTTAEKLWADISAWGYKCDCFQEWADNNPINIGNVEDLPTIIATTKSREQHVLQQWKEFTESAKQQEAISIIESRLWQTDSMYLYLSGHSEREIFASNDRVISTIAELNPVLINLAPQDIERLHVDVARQKNEKWRESGREGSWEEWGNHVYEQQEWFTSRLLDSRGMVRFFNEWVSIADKLYTRFPFRKIRIEDPQTNWDQSLEIIKAYLAIDCLP